MREAAKLRATSDNLSHSPSRRRSTRASRGSRAAEPPPQPTAPQLKASASFGNLVAHSLALADRSSDASPLGKASGTGACTHAGSSRVSFVGSSGDEGDGRRGSAAEAPELKEARERIDEVRKLSGQVLSTHVVSIVNAYKLEFYWQRGET